MKRPFVLACVVCCLIVGCDSRSDLEKLQGAWKLQVMHGEFDFGLPGSKGGIPILTFSGGAFTCEDDETHAKVEGTFTCDPSKEPKQITFTYSGRTVVAIYDIRRDAMQICVGKDDHVPPDDFAGGPRSRPALLIFDRLEAP